MYTYKCPDGNVRIHYNADFSGNIIISDEKNGTKIEIHGSHMVEFIVNNALRNIQDEVKKIVATDESLIVEPAIHPNKSWCDACFEEHDYLNVLFVDQRVQCDCGKWYTVKVDDKSSKKPKYYMEE